MHRRSPPGLVVGQVVGVVQRLRTQPPGASGRNGQPDKRATSDYFTRKISKYQSACYFNFPNSLYTLIHLKKLSYLAIVGTPLPRRLGGAFSVGSKCEPRLFKAPKAIDCLNSVVTFDLDTSTCGDEGEERH